MLKSLLCANSKTDQRQRYTNYKISHQEESQTNLSDLCTCMDAKTCKTNDTRNDMLIQIFLLQALWLHPHGSSELYMHHTHTTVSSSSEQWALIFFPKKLTNYLMPFNYYSMTRLLKEKKCSIQKLQSCLNYILCYLQMWLNVLVLFQKKTPKTPHNFLWNNFKLQNVTGINHTFSMFNWHSDFEFWCTILF